MSTEQVCKNCINFLQDETKYTGDEQETNGKCIMTRTGVGRACSDWTPEEAIIKNSAHFIPQVIQRFKIKSCFNITEWEMIETYAQAELQEKI